MSSLFPKKNEKEKESPMMLPELCNFLPRILRRKLLDMKNPIESPQMFSTSGVIMFVDISGFTPLTEQLSKRGAEGAEIIRNVLVGYFTKLLEVIHTNGGDTIKFAGDALMVLWEHPHTVLPSNLIDKDERICRFVVKCALELILYHYESNSTIADVEIPTLSIKIGIGVGNMNAMIVGGNESGDGSEKRQRWDFILTGDPLEQMSSCEHDAATNDVICSPRMWEKIQNHFEGEILPTGNVKVKSLLKGLSFSTFCDFSLLQSIRNDEIQLSSPKMEPLVKGFIQIPVLLKAESGVSVKLMAELRRISVVFLGLDMDVKSEKAFTTIQQIYSIIQQYVFQYGGDIRQFLVDDKGAVAIAVFGLPHMSHDDDPARAIHSSIRIYDDLKSKLNSTSAIGITTGSSFMGTLGSDSRYEYAMIGDTVNLSARLMVAAKNTKERYNILVDNITWSNSTTQFAFVTLEPIMVKGKTNKVLIYTPLDPEDVCIVQPKKLNFTRSRDVGYAGKILGRENERKVITHKIDLLLDPESKKTGFKSMVLVSSLVGMGKSALLDFVAQDDRVSTRRVQLFRAKSHSLQSNSPYLIWRQIFRLILGMKDGNTKYETILVRLRNLFEDAKMTNLLEYLPVLGVVLEWSSEGIPESDIMKLESQDRSFILHDLLKSILELCSIATPIVILLDDVQHMDESSFQFLCNLMENPLNKGGRLLIVAAVRSISKDTLDEKYAKIPSTQQIILRVLQDEHLFELATRILRSKCRYVIEHKAHSLEMTLELKQFLIKNSAGNPMFLVNSAFETSMFLEKFEKGIVTFDINATNTAELPNSIERAMITRYDKLNPLEQLILQVGSVVGFQVPFNILTAIFPTKTGYATILKTTMSLAEKGFISMASSATNLRDSSKTVTPQYFTFDFEVAKEVIYKLTSYSNRAKWHNAVGDWLKEHVYSKGNEKTSYSDISTLAQIAYHYKNAYELTKAIDFLEMCAEISFETYALNETISFLTEALQLNSSYQLGISDERVCHWRRLIAEALGSLGKHAESLEQLYLVVGYFYVPVATQITASTEKNVTTRPKTPIELSDAEIIVEKNRLKKRILFQFLFSKLRNSRNRILIDVGRATQLLMWRLNRTNTNLASLMLLVGFDAILRFTPESSDEMLIFSSIHVMNIFLNKKFFTSRDIHRMENYVQNFANKEAKTMFHLHGMLRRMSDTKKMSELLPEIEPYTNVKIWHNDLSDLRGMLVYYVNYLVGNYNAGIPSFSDEISDLIIAQEIAITMKEDGQRRRNKSQLEISNRLISTSLIRLGKLDEARYVLNYMHEAKLPSLSPALTMEYYIRTAHIGYLQYLLNPSDSQYLVLMKSELDLAMVLWPQATKSLFTIYLTLEMIIDQSTFLLFHARKQNNKEEIEKYQNYVNIIADGCVFYRASYLVGRGLMYYALAHTFLDNKTKMLSCLEKSYQFFLSTDLQYGAALALAALAREDLLPSKKRRSNAKQAAQLFSKIGCFIEAQVCSSLRKEIKKSSK